MLHYWLPFVTATTRNSHHFTACTDFNRHVIHVVYYSDSWTVVLHDHGATVPCSW